MIPKVAVCLIVKGTDDEAELLDNCLASLKGHVDQFFIDVNAPEGKKPAKRVIEVCKKYNTDYIETIWTGNFVKARNDNFARVPKEYDFIGWCDSDDTIDNPKKIREVAAIMDKNIDGLYIMYDYAHDEYGNVTVSHYVARLVRNNGTFKWKSSFADSDVTVHETLNETRSVGKVMNDEFKVIHHSTDERRDASLERNIELLEGMLDGMKSSPDPRILYYLATHYVDAMYFARAKVLFEQYLKLSGWAEERSQAWSYLGDIYQMDNDNGSARGCYMRAIAENPKDPIPYVEVGELEMKEQLWDKAIEWLETATKKEVDRTTVILRPLEATYRAYKALSECYANSGVKGYQKASKWLKKAEELRPFEPDLKKARELLDHLDAVRVSNEAVITIVNKLKNQKEEDSIVPLLENLPEDMKESPLVMSIMNYYREPVKWANKSIAIVCGSSALGSWGPWSLEEGIGGSEEAVVQLSVLLISMGWKVTVYATPGEKAGEYDGVAWKHYWEFNSADTFDVLVGWRNPGMFDKKYKARKTYLWLHDVVDREELFEQRIDNVDKIIFVSQYHRELFPFLPDEKCFASGNGIDPKAFEDTDGKFERNPKRLIYMSAHERGQDLLQTIWPKVKEAVPEAECDVYYGWTGYDEINKGNPERMEWKHKLLEQGKGLKDFRDNGKIGHDKIVEEIQKSGVWAYPTSFPEVYCITAAKAQAGGAWPVSSNFAALEDMVQFGYKQRMDEYNPHAHVGHWDEEEVEKYTQALIDVLKNPPTDEQRKEMMEWTRKNRSWEATAEGWSSEFTA